MASYAEVYARLAGRSGGILVAGGAARSTGIEAPTRALDASRAPLYGWYPGRGLQRLLERGRPARRGRSRRAGGDHPRLADDRHGRRASPTPSCATGWRASPARWRPAGVGDGRPGRRLHADGARGPGRHARLRAARGDPLGGLRRVRGARARGPDRRRAAEGDRRRVLRARAGAGRRLQAAGRRRDRDGGAQARVRARAAARAGAGRARGRATSTGTRPGGRGAGALRAGRAAPIRSTSSTPRGRPGSRRASCAPTAGHLVALAWTMPQHLRHRGRATSSGRRRTSAGWSGTPTSATGRCSPARRRSSSRASRSAPPTPAPSGG